MPELWLTLSQILPVNAAQNSCPIDVGLTRLKTLRPEIGIPGEIKIATVKSFFAFSFRR